MTDMQLFSLFNLPCSQDDKDKHDIDCITFLR